MKVLFWIMIFGLIGIGLYFLGQSNKKAYEDCLAEGYLSDELCFKYSYM